MRLARVGWCVLLSVSLFGGERPPPCRSRRSLTRLRLSISQARRRLGPKRELPMMATSPETSCSITEPSTEGSHDNRMARFCCLSSQVPLSRSDDWSQRRRRDCRVLFGWPHGSFRDASAWVC